MLYWYSLYISYATVTLSNVTMFLNILKQKYKQDIKYVEIHFNGKLKANFCLNKIW